MPTRDSPSEGLQSRYHRLLVELTFLHLLSNPLQPPPLSRVSGILGSPAWEDDVWVTPLQAPSCEQSAGLTLPTCVQHAGGPRAVLIKDLAMMPNEVTCVQDVGRPLAGFVKGPFLHDVALHQLQGARQGLTQLGQETILPAAVCQVEPPRQQAQLLWAAQGDASAPQLCRKQGFDDV